MAKSEKRRVYIYINGKEVENSLKSLTAESRKLKAQLAKTSDPKEFKRLSKELQNTEGKVKSLRNEAKGLGGVFGSLKKAVSSNLFAMVGWTAAIGLAVTMFTSAYKTIADFDESVADLAKTTGLAKEEARGLALEVIKIDTRTPVAQLLELATAAGRLGLKGKDVIGFARAADKSFVALGDSLEGSAEEIALTLGKLAGNFDLEKKYGIEESLNKIGSTVNELGANTKATEGPIVDFIKRMSGVAKAAKIPLPDIAALGALMDENGQSIEVASTTFNTLLPAIGKDVKKFAKVAGMDFEEFSALVRDKPFEALKAVAVGAKSSEKGLIGLTDTLETYGISSARSASIVSLLSENTERLTEIQEISNGAFEDGTSINAEFALKMDTMQAKTAVMSKTWDEFILSLDGSESVIGNVSKGFLEFFTKAIRGLGNLSAAWDITFGGIATSSAETKKKVLTDWETDSGFELSIFTKAFDKIPVDKLTSNIKNVRGEFVKMLENQGESYQDASDIFNIYIADRIAKEKEAITTTSELNKDSIDKEVEETKKLTAAEQAELDKRLKSAQDKAKKEAEAVVQEREKLIEKIASLKDQAVLADLSKDDAEIEKVKQKYAKLIDEAKGHNDLIIQLESLRDAEIATKQLVNNEKIQADIDAFNIAHAGTERERKLQVIDDEFTDKINKITGQSEEEISFRLQLENQKKQALDEQKAIFKEEDAALKEEERALELENQLILAEADLEARRLILEQQREMELSEKELTKSEIDVINKKYDDIEKADRLASAQSSLDIMRSATQSIASIINAASTVRLRNFDNAAEQELATFTGTKDEKIALEERLNAEREQLEREAFEKQKKVALVTALIDTASAVLKTLASIPYPASIPLAILAGVSGATQMAVIAGSKYDKGGYTGDGFGSPDESGFKIAGAVHEGEWVSPKWMTEDPQYADTIQMLETARQSKTGYAEGGNVSATGSTTEVPTVESSSTVDLTIAVNTLNNILSNGIIAKTIFDQADILALKDELDEINELNV